MGPARTRNVANSWLVLCYFSTVISGVLAAEESKYMGCYKDEGDPRATRGVAENLNDYSKGNQYPNREWEAVAKLSEDQLNDETVGQWDSRDTVAWEATNCCLRKHYNCS